MNYDEIESEYLTLKRQGMTDEGYWVAINGTEFDKEIYDKMSEFDSYQNIVPVEAFNPETLEYEQSDTLPRFIVDSDKKADWAIEKIKAERVEFDRLKKIALDRIAELNQRVKELQERTDRRTGNLEALLVEYFQTVTPTKITKTQTQYELLSGKLVLKHQQPEFVRDEATLLSWAETTAPEYVKIEKKVSWADLKKKADVSGEDVLYEGEVIPGIIAKARPDVFEVQA